MDIVRVAAASVNQIPLDWSGNVERIGKALREARQNNVRLICFPELSISAYGCEDSFLSLHTARQAEAALKALLPLTTDLVAAVGLPVYFHGAMYNCLAMVQNGRLLGINPKKSLAREGVHYEPRWFAAWPKQSRAQHYFCGDSVPFGDLSYSFGSFSVGIEICEEAWGVQNGAAHAAAGGVELVINASASHFALGKYQTREVLVADASRAMQVHYLYANLIGLEAGQLIYDGGNMVAESGTITARGKRFSFLDSSFTISDLDLDKVRVAKLQNRSIDLSQETYDTRLRIQGQPLKKQAPDQVKARIAHDHQSFVDQEEYVPLSRNEEFLRAQMQGLLDYLSKSGARGFVLSLSGGCDSSTVAILVAHAVAEGLKELGPEALAQRLHHPELAQEANPRKWIKNLLTVVYQATKQSGDITRFAAESLANEIGANYHFVDIEHVVESYAALAESFLGRDLNWQDDDLALQNIQARSRSPLIWLIANLKGAVLLSTSNRSEASVGYATMDGDTSGGLSPIAGIDKAFLRSWLKWAETDCHLGLGPLESLALVNEQKPTAELRPQGEDGLLQSDEEDLMPYDVLNVIETSFVRDRMDPQAIVLKLLKLFPAYSSTDHERFLTRFLTLWRQNQWKESVLHLAFMLPNIA